MIKWGFGIGPNPQSPFKHSTINKKVNYIKKYLSNNKNN